MSYNDCMNEMRCTLLNERKLSRGATCMIMWSGQIASTTKDLTGIMWSKPDLSSYSWIETKESVALAAKSLVALFKCPLHLAWMPSPSLCPTGQNRDSEMSFPLAISCFIAAPIVHCCRVFCSRLSNKHKLYRRLDIALRA